MLCHSMTLSFKFTEWRMINEDDLFIYGFSQRDSSQLCVSAGEYARSFIKRGKLTLLSDHFAEISSKSLERLSRTSLARRLHFSFSAMENVTYAFAFATKSRLPVTRRSYCVEFRLLVARDARPARITLVVASENRAGVLLR